MGPKVCPQDDATHDACCFVGGTTYVSYDSSAEACCEGALVTYDSDPSTDEICCGTALIDMLTTTCCDGATPVSGTGFNVCNCGLDMYTCEYGDYFQTKKVSICTKHLDDDSPMGYHFHNDCVDVDKLGVTSRPGDAAPDGREIYKCGCCPTAEDTNGDGVYTTMIETEADPVVVKGADVDYCVKEDCYASGASVCDAKDSKVEICVAKEDGSDTKEECKDPFYSAGKGHTRSNCGSCNDSRRERRMRSRRTKGI